jgi:hypothetical protein
MPQTQQGKIGAWRWTGQRMMRPTCTMPGIKAGSTITGVIERVKVTTARQYSG